MQNLGAIHRNIRNGDRAMITPRYRERDKASRLIEATTDPTPEAQAQKNKHGGRDIAARSIGGTQESEPEAKPRRDTHDKRDKATHHIEATRDPESEAQLQKDTHDKRDKVSHPTEATQGPEPEAQLQSGNQNEQRFLDDVVNIIEAEVRAAIPRRYYSGMLESERSSSAQPPTIYIVPRQLAMGNPSAYTPLAVRIGFIGLTDKWRSETPEKMEKYKMGCVRRLITSRQQAAGPPAFQDQDQDQDQSDAWTAAERRLLHKCLDTLKRLVPRIRAAYDDITWTLSNSSDDLIAEESLRDGCFVLHHLLKYARIARRVEQENSGGHNDDDDDGDDDWTLAFGHCWVWEFVTYDLLLLQNQIPFFVLQALFELLKSNPDEHEDILITGALELFLPVHPDGHVKHSSPIACDKVHHLLHLFYLSIKVPPSAPVPQHVPPSELTLWVRCATELKEAGVRLRARKGDDVSFLDVRFLGGVRLRARKGDDVSFLDVRFLGGVLEIPPLRLYDYSESMFRNLIAFEQTYPDTPGHITAYTIFMACLVTTHEDMRLLHQKGILVNMMSSGERDATRFFSSISAQTHTSAKLNYLTGLTVEVARYQRRRWPRWRASLVRNYFSNPWVITSVAAAVFLLCLAVVQTFFAVYAYFKPPVNQAK